MLSLNSNAALPNLQFLLQDPDVASSVEYNLYWDALAEPNERTGIYMLLSKVALEVKQPNAYTALLNHIHNRQLKRASDWAILDELVGLCRERTDEHLQLNFCGVTACSPDAPPLLRFGRQYAPKS